MGASQSMSFHRTLAGHFLTGMGLSAESYKSLRVTPASPPEAPAPDKDNQRKSAP